MELFDPSIEYYVLHEKAWKFGGGDIYNPQGWWREGKQIRWVLAEYGAWIYYYWKVLKEDVGFGPTPIEPETNIEK